MDWDEYVKEIKKYHQWRIENKVGSYELFLPKECQEKRTEEYKKDVYVYGDNVNSLENDEATVLYVIAMAVGAIFVDRWIIWIVATAIWLCYINRYKIRERKYRRNHKNER